MEIQRDLYLNKLLSRRHNGMIKVITGMRRCGKSYLLFNLFSDALRKDGVDDKHIIQINLEDRRHSELRDPDKLLQHIDSLITDKQMHYIMLDEVQMVREFEDVLNSYLHVNNADVYVTGSNARFLSKDVITEFRGRGDEVRIHPLSFVEFMSVWQGGQFIEQALNVYLEFGGLPKVVAIEQIVDKKEYLHNLFTHTYLKDIKERYSIQLDADLEELIDVIASNIGGLTNPDRKSVV